MNRPAVLKTKHRSVGPRKGVGNAFVPGTINPSGKKSSPSVAVPHAPVAFTLGDRIRATSDEPYFMIAPPDNLTVDHEHRPLLYQADGKALVRRAGFKQ